MTRKAALALLAPPAAFLVVAFFVPLWHMLGAALEPKALAWLATPYAVNRIGGALLQAILSATFSLLLAFPIAWFYHKHKIKFGRLHMAIHAAPFVMPVFVVVFGIQATFGANLDRWGPLAAVVIAHTYYNYGFATRLIHDALSRRQIALEQVAGTLGAGPFAAFWRTTGRILLPTIVGTFLLVFLFALASFGVVLYMGEGRVMTMETLLYQNLRGAFPNHGRAAALGFLQLVINVIVLLAYLRLGRRRVRIRHTKLSQLPANGRILAISWALVFCSVWPLLMVLAGGFQVQNEWSLEAWRALLSTGHPAHQNDFNFWHATGLSLMYAIASATIALGLTASLAYGLKMLGGKTRAFVAMAASLPLGTSSLLIGFGFTLAFGLTGFLNTWSGRMLIIAAHSLISFPFMARTMVPAIAQHDYRQDEMAATLGASNLAIKLRIHLPQLAGPIAAATGLALAMSIGDFGASLLLTNAENRNLSVWIDSHASSFNPVIRAQADALAGVIMVLAIAAYLLMEVARKDARN